MNDLISIDGRTIGRDSPPYIVAELSGNHNQDINRALSLIRAAKKAGADAVKLQTYTPESLTIDIDDEAFVIRGGTWDGERLYDLYSRAATPYEWFQRLFDEARQVGITIFSSPFDMEGVDLLESLNAPAYKIASPEIDDWPLIERVSRTGKPLIISTGAADLSVIEETLAFVGTLGCQNVAILHCISAYPAPVADSNLMTMTDLQQLHKGPVGLSDHTLGTTAAVAAVALGASVIEKHVTLSRTDGGVDSSFSLEPQELKELVQSCNDAYQSLGKVVYGIRESEKNGTRYHRVFYTSRAIEKGEILGPDNLKSIRALEGVTTRHYRRLFGKKAAYPLDKYVPVPPDIAID